jgi:hypothetical protein
MDWTDFDHDDQATLALHMITGHRRAAPLLWLSVWKDEIRDQRNDFEYACACRGSPNSCPLAAALRFLPSVALAIRSCSPFSTCDAPWRRRRPALPAMMRRHPGIAERQKRSKYSRCSHADTSA